MRCHFVSLGHDCMTEAGINRFLRQGPRLPFDHCTTPDFRKLLTHLSSRFENFVQAAYPEADIPVFAEGFQPTENDGVFFRHSPHALSSNEEMRCRSTASLGRRIVRLLNVLYSGEEVWMLRNAFGDLEEETALAQEFLPELCRIYRNPLLRIVVCSVKRGEPEEKWENFDRWKKLFTQWGFVQPDPDGIFVSLDLDNPGGVTVNPVRPP